MSTIVDSAVKTRIVYVNHTGQVSGAEKVLMNILRSLDRGCYQPIVVCPADGCLSEEAAAEGIPWIAIRPIRARFSRNPKQILKSMGELCKGVLSLRKVLRTVAPDMIHANTLRAGLATSLATLGTGRNVIWHVHDTLPRHPLSTLIRLFAYLDRRTRLVAVSRATARSFSGRLPFKGRMKTVYNGVELNKFPFKEKGQSPFRKEFHLSQDDFLFCAIGQICERKGLLELIEAFRQVRAAAPQVHLAIVGSVVFQHERDYSGLLYAAARVPELTGSVHFTGEMDDVYPALEAADLLVLNSRDEPFGLVLIEAMSSGTPVLATRVGGIPEIVTDGKDGWLIDPGDVRALAAKLLELSRDRPALAKVAEIAQRTTCPRFSMEGFQSRLRRLYEELEPKSDLRWNPCNQTARAQSMTRRGGPYA